MTGPRAHVSFEPLRRRIDRRVLAEGRTVRQVLLPDSTPGEWRRSGTRRALVRARSAGRLTLRARDHLCRALRLDPEEVYPE